MMFNTPNLGQWAKAILILPIVLAGGMTIACHPPASKSPPVVVSTAPSAQTSPSLSPTPAVPLSTQTPTTPLPSQTSPSREPLLIQPPTENCTISMAMVNDPDAPLNVRSTPDIQGNNVVGKLENNTFVSVIEETDGWLHIDTPVTGWIAKNRTQSSCAFVSETIPLTPTENSALVQGVIIGTGSHNYKLTLAAGQTLTIDNYKSVMPAVISPNNELLSQEANPDVKRWLIPIQETGEYTLQLDSNYKGFEYEFLVLQSK